VQASKSGSCKYTRAYLGDGWNHRYTTAPVAPYDLIDDAAVNVDTLSPLFKPGATNVLVLFAGSNDIWLDGASGSTTYSYFQTYISARLSAGWNASNIIVVTMLPRQSGSTQETARQAYNTALVGGASTYGYRLARVDQDSNIGCAGCQNNTTYYQSDQTHLTDAGQSVAASIIESVLP